MSKVKFAMLASALAVASTAMGVVRSGQTTDDSYLIQMDKVDGFHVGFDGRLRQFSNSEGQGSDYFGAQYNVVVAYDVGLSTTLYGLAGVGGMGSRTHVLQNKNAPYNATTNPYVKESNASFGASYGAGIWVNILDTPISTLFETIDSFRIQTAAQYSRFNCSIGAWDEVSGNLTFGLVNSVEGNKALWPVEIFLYAGPCVDFIWADLDDYDKGSDSFGGMVGLDIIFDKSIAFGASVEFFPNGRAYTGSAMFRF